MKRYFDSFIEFFVYVGPHREEYALMFASDWKFTEMLDHMCAQFAIDPDNIFEIRQTFVKRYKLSKDD